MIRKRPLLYLPVLVLGCMRLLGCPTEEPDPILVVTPAAVNFGSTGTAQSIAIMNNGGGLLSWAIEESVAWLAVDITSGVATTNIDRVELSVDRTGMAPGTYVGIVTIETNVGTKLVYVARTVPGDPVLEVSPLTVNLLNEEESGEFTISNTGDGPLTWSLRLLDPDDPDSTIDRPEWLTITPMGGTTAAGGESTVTVEVDRDVITEGIYGFLIEVSTAVGTEQVALNVAHGLSAEIGVDPDVLDFGTTGTLLSFDVFNTGARGSVLEFTLSTDRPDLIVFDMAGDPPGGSSIGTEDPDTYDRVTVPVVIVRSALTGETDGGTITVSAPGLDPVEVIVNVEAAPLTFEGAQNRTRPPFIMRFVFLLRDALGEAIDTTDPTILAELQTAFTVEEDGEILDPDETNVFVASADNLRYNIVLLLDFTNSMYNAGAGSGTVIDQMVSSSIDFVDDLFTDDPGDPPRSYRLAIMEYHERQQTNRVIHGFSTDPASLTAALAAFSLPAGENGASEVRDALIDACDRLAAEDLGVLSFDDADVRAVVFVTDGRDTSSIASLTEVINTASEERVRLYPIGFGDDVNTPDLVQMATDTGGHYYPAPDVDELIHLLENESGAPPNSDGLIVTELTRQIVLSYISLFQEGSHTYLVTANYDDLEGSFQRDGVFAIGGDIRAGQIGLRTAGIDTLGTAQVFIRTEYMPRNISQLRIRVISPEPYTIQLDPNGLLADWVLVPEAPDGHTGDVYTALTTEDNYLQYGAFGNLFRIDYVGLLTTDVFELGFRVDNRIHVNPPLTKFFQYPDSIVISNESSQANVVPILLDDGFDPDDPDAFDRDEDSVADFDDLYPDDDTQS
ncbi:MAG: VWA domain-containing protein [Candidatus Hydrogenedentes bacterium]|nr:VWA domain-containing protein [Candidatus Hydrogenedentota bacterium]